MFKISNQVQRGSGGDSSRSSLSHWQSQDTGLPNLAWPILEWASKALWRCGSTAAIQDMVRVRSDASKHQIKQERGRFFYGGSPIIHFHISLPSFGGVHRPFRCEPIRSLPYMLAIDRSARRAPNRDNNRPRGRVSPRELLLANTLLEAKTSSGTWWLSPLPSPTAVAAWW